MLIQPYYLMIMFAFAVASYDKSFEMISDPKIGPQGMPHNKTTSCKTFGKFARFNPHSIVDDKWFVFYYWDTPKPTQLLEFWIPSKEDMVVLHGFLDGHEPPGFNWSSTLLLVKDVLSKTPYLLSERGDRGQYWALSLYKDMPKGQITDYYDLRIKQTGNNKYLGVMDCKRRTAFIMCRLSAVPRQNKLQDAAATLGYRGRKGKSYLYSGHEWMPIPEQDEKDFWNNTHFKMAFMED